MAKQAKALDRRAVKDWFSDLTFEVQQAVLDDFSATFAESKERRISQLESELRHLRGQRAAVAVVRKSGRRKVSPKKGVKVPPKYIDKASGKTWAGRGVKPVWVQLHLKKGGKLDDLLIAKHRAR